MSGLGILYYMIGLPYSYIKRAGIGYPLDKMRFCGTASANGVK